MSSLNIYIYIYTINPSIKIGHQSNIVIIPIHTSMIKYIEARNNQGNILQ
jgi:hypothetical protein